MMSTKKGKDVKDDAKKGENMDNMNQNGEQKTQEDYFKIPKPKLPKISKEVLIMWLKRIGVFLLGALTGAVAVVGAAMKVANKNEPEKDEFEDDGDAEENEIEEDESPSEDDEA